MCYNGEREGGEGLVGVEEGASFGVAVVYKWYKSGVVML